MVHIVPPLDGANPAGGASPRAADLTPVASSPLGDDIIEQFAAEGVVLISDDAPAPPVAPPPLPRDPSVPALAFTPVGKSGVLIAAGVVAALLAIGVVAWTLASYLSDDTAPAIAALHDEPAKHEQEARQNEPLSSDNTRASESPEPPIPKPDEPAASPLPQANSDSKTTKVTPASESADSDSGLRIEAAGSRPPDTVAATSGESESPIALPDARAKPADADKQPADVRPALKPSLRLDELPRPELPDSDPVVAQSAGQEAGQATDPEAPDDPREQADPKNEPVVAGEGEDSADPPLRRIAPNQVDVPARLAAPIAAIQFRDAPLHETMNTISDLAGVPIGLEVDALRAAGVRVERPMTFVAKSVTVADALKQGLHPLGLTAREQNGSLQVLPADAGQTRKARYAVDDLVRSGDPPIDDLVEIVRAVVPGRAIAEDGNSFAVTAENGAIYLTAHEIEHDRMIELCEKLRVARGRPLRTRFDANRPDPRFDPRRFELATRRTKALGVLAKPVTAGVGRPAPLCDVVDFLARQTGATIVVDQAALAAAGLAAETDARLVAAFEPLETSLSRLLAPLGLAFRVVDGKVLEVTTSDATLERVCIEFYALRGFAGGALAAGDLEAFREKLLAASGIADSKAAIKFDPASESLIVCASYPEHVRLEQAVRKLNRP
jgi:hypothetical protein